MCIYTRISYLLTPNPSTYPYPLTPNPRRALASVVSTALAANSLVAELLMVYVLNSTLRYTSLGECGCVGVWVCM